MQKHGAVTELDDDTRTTDIFFVNAPLSSLSVDLFICAYFLFIISLLNPHVDC